MDHGSIIPVGTYTHTPPLSAFSKEGWLQFALPVGPVDQKQLSKLFAGLNQLFAISNPFAGFTHQETHPN